MVLQRPWLVGIVAGGALALPALIWVLWQFDPNVAGNPFPPCLFRYFTGYFCAGCGLTRAMHALVHGDIARAFAMNPLAMLLMPAVPLLLAHAAGWRSRYAEPLMKVLLSGRFWLILLPAFWIGRNLPWFPFTLLAPG
jgi:hypothetical protein